MTGDCHVRFCESGRGRFPPATHQAQKEIREGFMEVIDERAETIASKNAEIATLKSEVAQRKSGR